MNPIFPSCTTGGESSVKFPGPLGMAALVSMIFVNEKFSAFACAADRARTTSPRRVICIAVFLPIRIGGDHTDKADADHANFEGFTLSQSFRVRAIAPARIAAPVGPSTRASRLPRPAR